MLITREKETKLSGNSKNNRNRAIYVHVAFYEKNEKKTINPKEVKHGKKKKLKPMNQLNQTRIRTLPNMVGGHHSDTAARFNATTQGPENMANWSQAGTTFFKYRILFWAILSRNPYLFRAPSCNMQARNEWQHYANYVSLTECNSLFAGTLSEAPPGPIHGWDQRRDRPTDTDNNTNFKMITRKISSFYSRHLSMHITCTGIWWTMYPSMAVAVQGKKIQDGDKA